MENVNDANNVSNDNQNQHSEEENTEQAAIIAQQESILEYTQSFSLLNSNINLQELIENDKIIKEPKWTLLMFEWMTSKITKNFFLNQNFKKVLTDSNVIFLEGLLHEYGIHGYEKNYRIALEKYNEGIKYDNQYCLYRMFYILINDSYCEKFNLIKSYELALIFLIKSCAYNESYLDINRIEPVYKLNSLLISSNKKLEFFIKIVENYSHFINNDEDKNSILNLNMNELEIKYLSSFLLVSFPSSVKNLKEALEKLEDIAEDHCEACFKLACIYYTPMYRDHINKDIGKSIKYFDLLENKNYTRSICSYYKVCEEQKIFDKLISLITKAKTLRGYSSHFYANFICREKENLELNKKKILKYFFKSLLFGNLISVVIIFEILTKLYLAEFKRNPNFTNYEVDFGIKLNFIKNCSNNNEINSYEDIRAYMLNKFSKFELTLEDFMSLIFEFVSIQKNDPHINKILDYDVLVLFYQIHAYFYYKGYIVEKNYEKAIEIMEETFKKEKSVKCYRKIFYYLGKSYKKVGNMTKFEFYMKKSFDIYILLSEFPYHHFIVAKTFLRGIKGVQKNLDYAIYYFKCGFNYNENNFFINVMYSKKCEKYLVKNDEIRYFVNSTVLSSSKMITDIYIDNENVCIICYANFKQVRHSKCNHKLICLLCYDKMQNKNQCPFCKQVSEANNEFQL